MLGPPAFPPALTALRSIHVFQLHGSKGALRKKGMPEPKNWRLRYDHQIVPMFCKVGMPSHPLLADRFGITAMLTATVLATPALADVSELLASIVALASFFGTLWLCAPELKALPAGTFKLKQARPDFWIGPCLLVVQAIFLTVYYTSDNKSLAPTVYVQSVDQKGGQIAQTINNNGPSQSELRAALAQPPRVAIKTVVPVLVEGEIRLNVYYSNDGQREVRGVIPHVVVGVANGDLTKEAEDSVFAGLADLKPAPDPNSLDAMQPGENRFTTLPGQIEQRTGLTKAKLESIEKNKQVIYFAIMLRYFDAESLDIWVTEWCEFWGYRVSKTLARQLAPKKCIGHNRIARAVR